MCVDKVSFTPLPIWKKAWHIDGLTDEHETFQRKGGIGNFTCLVGVALRDIPAPFHDNLAVHPGSHLLLQDHFRRNPSVMQDLCQRGDPALPRNLPFRELTQVCMKAGDVVIAHYQLAHTIAPNCSPDIRYVVRPGNKLTVWLMQYQIYFRVFAQPHAPHRYRPEAMLDVFLDWRGDNAGESDAGIASAMGEQLVIAQTRERYFYFNFYSFLTLTCSKLPYDPDRIALLQPQADAKFDAQKWQEAMVLYSELADRQADDFTSHFKAALCHFFVLAYPGALSAADKQRLSLAGEAYAQSSVSIMPTFPASHAIVVRLRSLRGDHAGALTAADAMVACPPVSPGFEWAKDAVGEGMKGAAVACAVLKLPPSRIDGLRALAAKNFPTFMDKIDACISEGASEPLWAESKALMDAEPKDWPRLQQVCGQLARLHPDSFWARLQAGASLTYGAKSEKDKLLAGEEHLTAAIGINPLDMSAFGALARNLLWQGKAARVGPVVDTMLQGRFEPHATIFVLDGLRAGREAMVSLGSPREMAAPMFARARAAAPALAAEIDKVNRESPGCVIF